MKKASEYRQLADECRALARDMANREHLSHLLSMADAWDQLAAERAEFVIRYPERAMDGEYQEEARRARRGASSEERA